MTTKIISTSVRSDAGIPWYHQTPESVQDQEFVNLSVLISEQLTAGNIEFDVSYPDDYTNVCTLILINEAAYLAANNMTSVEELLNSSPQSVVAYNATHGITETSTVETV